MTQYLVTTRSRHEPAAPQQLYLLDGDLAPGDVGHLASALLHDPVVQVVAWCALEDLDGVASSPDNLVVEVAYKPGVTDNEAESVRIGAGRLGISGLRAIKTLRRVTLPAGDQTRRLEDLFNPLIETVLIGRPGEPEPPARRAFYETLLRPPTEAALQVARLPLRDAADEDLMRISQAGVLSLDLVEMRAIRAYFRQEDRDPTDGELETLAQTWSEHCSHKTFKAKISYHNKQSVVGCRRLALPDEKLYRAYHLLEQDAEIDSLIKTFLIAATDRVLETKERPTESSELTTQNWVLSAFVDNAGIVAFGDDYEISIKVETHNHPSALEPFGGANTGVGGVVRDVLGVSALPIANTDVLCFGPLDLPAQELSSGVLHPRQVAAGVVAGVRDYGNKLGIPTVNGAVLYERGYTANPLVFCGTVGLAPRGRHPRNVRPGDAIVVLGGRTGRDGIHGATFSSVELTHTTAQEVGSAVQIGDPITEKKVMDVLLQARDAGLYSAITDCGAGGLSSAVGEMGAETGAAVVLDDVPLKYAGLQPWEIWLSEAQERMVLAVPPAHLDALLELCAGEDVEATVIGRFTGDQRLTVTHREQAVVDLGMEFLHGGIPQRVLEAVWKSTAEKEIGRQVDRRAETADQRSETGNRRQETQKSATVSSFLVSGLLSLLAHPNIASKAAIIRTYDHEVRGATVVKPLVGANCDGPGDAAVLQPVRTMARGVAIGCGVNPRYGEIDPYWMALACVDEALRNVVAVGGNPRRTAILDNFCWGDPRQPDRMAGLVRAAAGCYDAAVAFGAPFVSGKDSLNNEYRDAEGRRTPIPPTLLITALASVPDIRRAVTMDLKEPGNYVYLVGETRHELGGSHYDDVRSEIRDWRSDDEQVQSPVANLHSLVPKVDLAIAPSLFAALHGAIAAGLVRACHDLSEGGLAVAAAEMAFAGERGLRFDLRDVPRQGELSEAVLLFSESPSRFLVEVRPEDAPAFEAALARLPFGRVGEVDDGVDFAVAGLAGEEVIRANLADLKAAWQHTVVV
jgi:phosphoribosylformylglycinamidine synthase subunit PurSL